MSQSIPTIPFPIPAINQIDTHTRQAWALAEFLTAHYAGPGERILMSDEIMACLMENIASHLKEIQKLSLACARQEVPS